MNDFEIVVMVMMEFWNDDDGDGCGGGGGYGGDDVCKLCGHFRWSLRDLTGTEIQMYASVLDQMAPESVLMCFSVQNGPINVFFFTP